MMAPNILMDIMTAGDTKNEDFLNVIHDLASLEFQLKDVPQSSRVIHNYEQLDLLMEKRESPGAWKKYSTEDVIWLHVVMALREFGVPIETLKKAKESIISLTYRNEKTKEEYAFLTSLAAAAFVDRFRYYLIFNNDGKCTPINSSKYMTDWVHEKTDVAYISIPLHSVISMIHEEMYDEPLKGILVKEITISDQVFKILNILVSDNDYKELIIEYKDKQPTRIKITKSVDVSKKLEQVLSERQYIDIKVVKANGQKVSLE